jgi:hypothetical protein
MMKTICTLENKNHSFRIVTGNSLGCFRLDRLASTGEWVRLEFFEKISDARNYVMTKFVTEWNSFQFIVAQIKDQISKDDWKEIHNANQQAKRFHYETFTMEYTINDIETGAPSILKIDWVTGQKFDWDSFTSVNCPLEDLLEKFCEEINPILKG